MKPRSKKLWIILLSLVLVLGLMPGMNATAYAQTEIYTKLKNDRTVVNFHDHVWYIIADDSSSATAGTVTLLAADSSFGTSKFDNNQSSNAYSSSTVKGVLDALTAEGGAFASVKDAIADTDLSDVNVTGAKLYLLSTSEVGPYANLNFTGAQNGIWWLRSPGSNGDKSAAFVLGNVGHVIETGYHVGMSLGVRPALKLNLSSVIFDSESNTFSLKPAHTHSFTYSVETGENANTITATCGEGCDITEGLTLTISAPTGDLTADDSKTFPATLSTGYNITAFPEGSISAISYTKDGQPFDGTPTEAGEYTASVTVGGATASVSYTVTAPAVAVTGVTLTKGGEAITAPIALTVGGDTATLTATVAPDNATDKTVTWASSNTSVATVENGVVTAVAAGSATITATATNGTETTDDDFSASCTVNVSDPAPSASIDFKGGSLRRRVYTGTTDVVDFETDIRFGFEFTLPEGATINMSDSYFCWKNNSVATAEDGNKVTIQSVDTSGEKPVANLILTGVPKAYYTTNIFCFVHVEYTLNEQVYTIETVEPYSRSVKQVCDSLVEDTTAPGLWRDYAKSLLDAIG